MLCVPLLIVLLSVIYRPISSAVVLADFQQQALAAHNAKRQLHCTPPMILNSTLNTIAQAYANYLVANNLFQHSLRAGVGENLWYMGSSAVITTVDGSQPTTSWYNEISAYNFNLPGFSATTGHFTQVVWRGSTQLGVGIAFAADGKSAKVVANYYPAGNMLGSFPANVAGLCPQTTTVRTTTTTKRVGRRAVIEAQEEEAVEAVAQE